MEPEPDLAFAETGPERTCIVTRRTGDPRGMVRFVVGPDGAVVPDIRARLPGRGAWVEGVAATVAAAVKRRAFSRAFKRDVTVAAALPDEVEALLARDALHALSLANKAGLVLTGAFKVEDALGSGRVLALLHAVGGSPDGIRKIDAAARRSRPPGAPPIPSVQIFAASQLDLALGRANVIHAALLVGGASEAVLQKAARLHSYLKAGLPERTEGHSAAPPSLPS